MKPIPEKPKQKRRKVKRSSRHLERGVGQCDRKLYAAIWINNGGVGATPNTILVGSACTDYMGKIYRDKKGVEIDSLAIFRRKCDALTFVDDNPDWGIVKISVA